MQYISELVNWLLEQGKLVSVFSNLAKDTLQTVQNSDRFRIVSTYHRSDDYQRFCNMFWFYKGKGFNIGVEEIETAAFEDSKYKPMSKGKNDVLCSCETRLIFMPDGNSCFGFEEFYKRLNPDA